MTKNKTNSIKRNELREEALHNCPFLGYDRDALGTHLYSRGAYKIAETQFRRAVHLNPYEPIFKEHLAQCLRRLGKYEEALSLMESISTKEETVKKSK